MTVEAAAEGPQQFRPGGGYGTGCQTPDRSGSHPPPGHPRPAAGRRGRTPDRTPEAADGQSADGSGSLQPLCSSSGPALRAACAGGLSNARRAEARNELSSWEGSRLAGRWDRLGRALTALTRLVGPAARRGPVQLRTLRLSGSGDVSGRRGRGASRGAPSHDRDRLLAVIGGRTWRPGHSRRVVRRCRGRAGATGRSGSGRSRPHAPGQGSRPPGRCSRRGRHCSPFLRRR
jgi:hypothetical protein